MKKFVFILSMFIFSLSAASVVNHAKHNMILMGEDTVFASHIVYKEPHNYQVLVQIKFDAQTQAAYLKAKSENPRSLFLYLLDSMNIKEIASKPELSGTLLFENSEGKKEILATQVKVPQAYFKMIYFDELPLSLKNEDQPHH